MKCVAKRYMNAGLFIRTEPDPARGDHTLVFYGPEHAPSCVAVLDVHLSNPEPAPGMMVIESDYSVDWMPEEDFRRHFSHVE